MLKNETPDQVEIKFKTSVATTGHQSSTRRFNRQIMWSTLIIEKLLEHQQLILSAYNLSTITYMICIWSYYIRAIYL